LNSNTKLVACVTFILASAFFLSVTFLETRQRDERLATLSNDDWVKQKIAETFPGFPVVSYLGNVTNTAEKLKEPGSTNMARIVEIETCQHTEYYRWFTVSEREPNPVQWDPTNHYHVGVVTSDLEVFDFGLDVGFQ
jgi:hypothetical protein